MIEDKEIAELKEEIERQKVLNLSFIAENTILINDLKFANSNIKYKTGSIVQLRKDIENRDKRIKEDLQILKDLYKDMGNNKAEIGRLRKELQDAAIDSLLIEDKDTRIEELFLELTDVKDKSELFHETIYDLAMVLEEGPRLIIKRIMHLYSRIK